MADARDRLSRAESVAAVYARWRRAINNPNPIRVRIDEPEEVRTTTPFRWGATEMTGPSLANGSGGFGRGRTGTPRIRRQRIGRENVYSPLVVGGSVFRGRDNRGRGGRGRATGGSSLLPSWYPRTPLRDITSITRAIERRRIASFREGESHQLESLSTLDRTINEPNMPAFGAQLEHDISLVSPFAIVGNRNSQVVSAGSVLKTPYPTLGNKRYNAVSVGKVPKILLDITNQNAEDSEFLTPQRKLLNSIDSVEKVVMDELCKLKRTPTAKKTEREKKVRTLMSMR